MEKADIRAGNIAAAALFSCIMVTNEEDEFDGVTF